MLLTFSNKRGDKLLSGTDRVTFVLATISYSSSPPLFLAPQILGAAWPAATRVLSRSKRENHGTTLTQTLLKALCKGYEMKLSLSKNVALLHLLSDIFPLCRIGKIRSNFNNTWQYCCILSHKVLFCFGCLLHMESFSLVMRFRYISSLMNCLNAPLSSAAVCTKSVWITLDTFGRKKNIYIYISKIPGGLCTKLMYVIAWGFSQYLDKSRSREVNVSVKYLLADN